MENKKTEILLKKKRIFNDIYLDKMNLEELLKTDYLLKNRKKFNKNILNYLNILKKRINLLKKENLILKENLKKYSGQNIFNKEKGKIKNIKLSKRFNGLKKTIKSCLSKVKNFKTSLKPKEYFSLIIKEIKRMSSGNNYNDWQENAKNNKLTFFKKTDIKIKLSDYDCNKEKEILNKKKISPKKEENSTAEKFLNIKIKKKKKKI